MEGLDFETTPGVEILDLLERRLKRLQCGVLDMETGTETDVSVYYS